MCGRFHRTSTTHSGACHQPFRKNCAPVDKKTEETAAAYLRAMLLPHVVRHSEESLGGERQNVEGTTARADEEWAKAAS